MLAALRRSHRLAQTLVLAMIAGPLAVALCPHAEAMPLAPEAEAAVESHAMAEQEAPAPPPCHETPEPEPAEDADCLSACCAAETPAPLAPTLPLDAPADVPTAPEAEAPAAPAEVTHVAHEPEPPPLSPARLHLLLGRFLT